MTSNLGATIPYGMNIGFGSEGTIFSITNVEKSIRETFRSELINRIDRTVVFRPLGRKIVEEILYKELKSILSRRGFRSREWAVEWEESAIEFLIQKGFSKEFGARPLKRAIERYLLSPLSITILNHQYPEGDQFLFISSDGNKILVEFVDPNEKEIETSLEKDITKIEKEKSELTLKSIVLFQKGILDELSLIEQKTNDLKGKIQSEIWENNKHLLIKETSNINFWDSPQRFEILSKIEYMDRVESSFKIANSLLERIKGTDYNSNKKSFSKPLIKRIAQQLYLIETANRDLEENKPNESFLLVESFDSYPPNNSIIEYTASLFSMYKNWAKKRRMRFEVLFDSTKINNVSRYVASISGFGAYTILEPETGIHVFESTEADKNVTKNKIRVKVAAQLIEHIDKKESLLSIADKLFSNNTNPTNKIVRTYRYKSSPLVKDNNRKWKTGRIDKVLGGDFDLMS